MNMKPEKPDESACCGSGCNPCIFDVYERQLKNWEDKKLNDEVSDALDVIKFSPFLVETVDTITPQIKMFKFQCVKLLVDENNASLISNAICGIHYETKVSNLCLKAGHYLILKGQYELSDQANAEGQLNNISRSYTPILNDCTEGSFKVAISILPSGKMSQFLNKLKEKDIVFWRGPYKEFFYKPNTFQRLLLIGGGTGVVPLYNISKEIVQNEIEETQIKCLVSFKTVQSIILRKELNNLQDYWNFVVEMYITNQMDSNYSLKYNEHVIFSKIDKDIICQELSNLDGSNCFIIICGPDLFNKFVSSVILDNGFSKENIFIFE